MAQNERRITRRDFLKTGIAAVPIAGLGLQASAALKSSIAGQGRPKNVLIFITDQQRAVQHFPDGWEEENLLNLTRLKKNGLSFQRAFTNACMCSPARSTLMSGFFPAQHGVKYTLEEDMPAKEYPQFELPLDLPNIATVMSAAGYNVVYKGKWHCSKPNGKHFVRIDLQRYGFYRWDPPDAGANQSIEETGGGYADNDGRFMNQDGQWHAGKEGALAYLSSVAATQQPFCMIVSLVNPHDVLLYPRTYVEAGYTGAALAGDIQIPVTIHEDLSTKPTVQTEFLHIATAGLGPLVGPDEKRNYLNFYGNLMIASDKYLGQILDVLDRQNLTNDTLIISTADHGEMGLTHDGLRQKNFNFYEETTRVPLVYSNPLLYPTALQSNGLVSHVDFLPTLASLFNAPSGARANWEGVDYSSLVLDPSSPPVQDYTVFTYDDYQSGQPSGPYPKPPNHIVSIREERYKLAEYYAVNGKVESQWEMYDLLTDPLEVTNIAWPSCNRSSQQQKEYDRLKVKLEYVKSTRLQPLPDSP